jgi:dTDP-4-amino-4,6-dideoxygalactose transaminase
VGFAQHLPHADRLLRRMPMLPMNMAVSDDDVHYVSDQVLPFYGR